jgi:hypothetical protein
LWYRTTLFGKKYKPGQTTHSRLPIPMLCLSYQLGDRGSCTGFKQLRLQAQLQSSWRVRQNSDRLVFRLLKACPWVRSQECWHKRAEEGFCMKEWNGRQLNQAPDLIGYNATFAATVSPRQRAQEMRLKGQTLLEKEWNKGPQREMQSTAPPNLSLALGGSR